jgi:hypothetical protein
MNRKHCTLWITLALLAVVNAIFFAGRAAAQTSGVPLIDFESWPQNPRRDLTIIAPDAQVVATTMGTAAAHSGEHYLEIKSSGEYAQRDVKFENLSVKPNSNYELSFFYRTTARLGPLTARVETLQYDKEGKLLLPHAVSWDLLPLPAAAWTPARREFKMGPETTRFVIYFRLISVLPGSSWFLDDIALKPGAPSTNLKWEIDPKTATLSGSVTATSDIADQVQSKTVVILQDGKVVKSQNLSPGENDFKIDLHDLTDNISYYIAAFADLKNGTRIVSENNDLNDVRIGRQSVTANIGGRATVFNLVDKYNLFYTFIKPESRFWVGNDIGLLKKNDAPPKPWSGLKFDAKTNAVTNWNNIFTLRDGLSTLDIQFQNPAQKLARAPISLSLDGKKFAEQFQFSPIKPTSISPNKIVLSSSGQNAQLKLETNLEIEFDGFARYSLKLTPKTANASINDLTLNIPFAPDFVKYFYGKDGMEYKTNYATKEFYPTFYAGNDDTGLLWCAEKLLPGKRVQDNDYLTLSTPDTKTSTLEVHLVNARMQIPADGLTIEFALEPAPTRPTNPSLRNARFRTGNDSNLDAIGTSLNAAFPYYGYPELAPRAEFDKFLAWRNMPNATNLMNLGAGYAMETIPLLTYFKKEWLKEPRHTYPTTIPSYLPFARGDMTAVNMAEPIWTDWMLWKFKKMLLETPEISGTYNDTAYPEVQEKDGLVFSSVFAGRKFHQRIYVLLQQMRGNEARTIYHQGLDTILPYAAYADLVLNGEHLRGPLFENSYYTEFMGLPELRATFASPLGPAHMFLPQYWQAEKANDPKLLAHTGGIALLHDDIIWLGGQETLKNMVREKINFGDLSKANWFPYWQPNPYLQTGNEKIVASFYQRGGDLFIILFNNSVQKQTADLKLLAPFLKKNSGGDARVYDPATNSATTISLGANAVRIELEPWLPKLLTLKK